MPKTTVDKCPMCDRDVRVTKKNVVVEGVTRGGFAIECPTPEHCRFDVTDTVWESAYRDRSDEQWARAFESAKKRASGGTPDIESYDFAT
jgi:hypothetical protein